MCQGGVFFIRGGVKKGNTRTGEHCISNVVRHPFHLVDPSPWPILSAAAAIGLVGGLVQLFYSKRLSLFLWRMLRIVLVVGQ